MVPDSDYEYAGRLMDFIIAHIGKPYTAEECGSVLELRLSTEDPADGDHTQRSQPRPRSVT